MIALTAGCAIACAVRERFVVRSLANRLWGLPAYYAGQLLLAWSIAA